MGWSRGLVIASLAACSFQRGALPDASDGDAVTADADDAATMSPDASPMAITYVGHATGKSTTATVTVAASAMPGATYVLGVSPKPFETVASVTGLGATWARIGDQCGARSQTGAALYIGRGATTSGNVTVTLSADPANVVAIVATYAGSTSTGALATYNALDATTCNATNTNVDVNTYAFSIAATNRVVAAIATRQHGHTPGAGLVQRAHEMHGSSGDTAGLAIVDGVVTTVAGTFTTDVDVGAVAVELRP